MSFRSTAGSLFALWLWSLAFCTSAHAQNPTDAELALSRGSYAQARELAQAAIQSGTGVAGDLLRSYRVLALSCAYLDDGEAATRAFTTLLALDPGYRLPEGLPPQVRSPYMNARGFWSLHGERLAVQPELDADPSQLQLRVYDPAALAARVRVRMRPIGKQTFIESVRVPAPELTITIAGLGDAEELEYSVALLDEHGNRIWQLGSDREPQHLTRRRVAPLAPPPLATAALAPTQVEAPTSAPVQPARRRPYLVAGTSLVVLGALSVALGGYAHLRHEQLAKRWNSGDCDGTGTTRGSICAAENREMEDMTRLSLVSYGAGAAALLTGTVLFLLSPARTTEREARPVALGCTGGPGALGLACAGRF